MKLKLTILFSTVLTSVLSAPHPVPQNAPAPGPFAAIGGLIQRLQSSFYEGSASIRQPQPSAKAQNLGNETLVRLQLPSSASSKPSTTTTTTTTTTTPRPVTNAFDSINAILDNLNRPSNNNNNNNNNNIDNNNLFGNPQPNLIDLLFTTTTPAPTTRSPFDLDGVGQGINAFLQAFIKTNIQKIFRQPGQDQQQTQQQDIRARSDSPPSIVDTFFNTLFRKRQY
ncbi:hypothetical protein Ocin01_04782 [Orchesella cincta]|uniref:Uncharacterized protein n=1 Tax=Orchesella cincta TaxID=48709 RepID=A0A1D2N9E2_ORCCI|nr:hypothetical protein Ocin01_04782 [Orchesella cincta]